MTALYLWPSMPEIYFPPYKWGLGRGRKSHTSQLFLPGIKPLKHTDGSAGRVRRAGRVRCADGLSFPKRHHSPYQGTE